MGGNALKGCKTRRYSADEYMRLEADVVNRLVFLFGPESSPAPIAAYSSKESFVDMDIVIKSDKLPSDYVRQIEVLFEPKQLVKNGNVLSFEYKEFQIDLIITPSSEYQTSLNYFAYNDLGNLIGRIAHSMGLKLGHDGLSYNWRVETYQFKNIILLTDWKDILPVLGYSYERYAQGFDTLEDIFKFVVSSPFFNKDIYLLRNRNHTSRVRDAKRKTYMEFLKWIEDYEETDAQNLWKEWVSGQQKTVWLPYLFRKTPHFEAVYNEVQKEWDEAVEFKKRFNGDLVKEWTGLEGKELGKFMHYIKQECGDRLQTDIVKMNPTIVSRYVMYFYDKYLGNLPVINFDAEAMKQHRVK